MIRVQVAEAEVHNINIRFLDRKTYVLSNFCVESIIECFVGHLASVGLKVEGLLVHVLDGILLDFCVSFAAESLLLVKHAQRLYFGS